MQKAELLNIKAAPHGRTQPLIRNCCPHACAPGDFITHRGIIILNTLRSQGRGAAFPRLAIRITESLHEHWVTLVASPFVRPPGGNENEAAFDSTYVSIHCFFISSFRFDLHYQFGITLFYSQSVHPSVNPSSFHFFSGCKFSNCVFGEKNSKY